MHHPIVYVCVCVEGGATHRGSTLLVENYQEDERHSTHLVICRQRTALTFNDSAD